MLVLSKLTLRLLQTTAWMFHLEYWWRARTVFYWDFIFSWPNLLWFRLVFVLFCVCVCVNVPHKTVTYAHTVTPPFRPSDKEVINCCWKRIHAACWICEKDTWQGTPHISIVHNCNIWEGINFVRSTLPIPYKLIYWFHKETDCYISHKWYCLLTLNVLSWTKLR